MFCQQTNITFLEFNQTEPIKNGVRIYAQSKSEDSSSLQGLRTKVISCIARPRTNDTFVENEKDDNVWHLIDNGCILDKTVKIMPRGPQNQFRFSFKTFSFVEAPDSEVRFDF